jgi:hypothetical protein
MQPPAIATTDRFVVPLDRARASFYRAILATPLRRAVVHKDTRVLWRAFAGIGLAFALTLVSPLLLFAIAPIVLGVPHLAADLRYLVLQPRHARVARGCLLVGCLPFVALRAFSFAGDAPLEMGLATLALVGCAIASSWSARRPAVACLVVPGLVLLGVLAIENAALARIVFAHAHNVIAIVAWGVLFRARRTARTLWLPVAATAIATAVLFAYGVTNGTDSRAFGLQLSSVASWLAPGLAPRLGGAVVLSYVFLQSVHYTIWLGLVPEDAVRGDASRSFRMSVRALVRDFGGVGLGLVALGSIAILLFATRDLHHTREAYLTLSAFHGYLELAALVIALCGRRDLFALGVARAS